MRTIINMDFARHEEFSANEKMLLRSLILSFFAGERKFLPARAEGRIIYYSLPYSSGEGEYKISISHDILKSEKPFLYHVINGDELGTGRYGEAHAGNLDLYVSPDQELGFLPLGKLAQYAFKFVEESSADFAKNETELNQAYRPGEKGQESVLTPPKAGENTRAIVQMPRRAGKNLDQWNIPSMEFWERFHIVKGIITEVRRLHSANIIHRDLKKSNIVYEGKIGPDKFGDIRIVDLGLATTVEKRHDHTAMGAVGHRPPEALGKFPNIVKASDIYSLGPIVAEILGATIPCRLRDDFYLEAEKIRISTGVMTKEKLDLMRSYERQMTTAKLDLCGIFEGFIQPTYFENEKKPWEAILINTGQEKPESRPKLDDFDKLIASLETKRDDFPDIIKQLNPLFESIQFLLRSEFLKDFPDLKQAFLKKDLESLPSFFPKLLEISEEVVQSFSINFVQMFIANTFEIEAKKLIREILSACLLLKVGLMECKIDSKALKAKIDLLQKNVAFITQLETTWSQTFEKKLCFYLQKHSLSQEFATILKIIEGREPIFKKLDTLVFEAKRLQKLSPQYTTSEAGILLTRLANLSSRLGKEDCAKPLQTLDQLIQDTPKPSIFAFGFVGNASQ